MKSKKRRYKFKKGQVVALIDESGSYGYYRIVRIDNYAVKLADLFYMKGLSCIRPLTKSERGQ